jgi:hypothetical protein
MQRRALLRSRRVPPMNGPRAGQDAPIIPGGGLTTLLNLLDTVLQSLPLVLMGYACVLVLARAVTQRQGRAAAKSVGLLRSALAIDERWASISAQVPSAKALSLVVAGWGACIFGLLPWWPPTSRIALSLGITLCISLMFAHFHRASCTRCPPTDWRPAIQRDWTGDTAATHTFATADCRTPPNSTVCTHCDGTPVHVACCVYLAVPSDPMWR